MSGSRALRRRLGRLWPAVHWVYRCVSPIGDPVRLVRAVPGYLRFAAAWLRYRRLPDAEALRIRDVFPVLGEATSATGYDPHYVHQAVWATRRIAAERRRFHVDVGSDHRFCTLLTTHLPLVFVDYRPLKIRLPDLHSVAGDILALPFATSSVESLSCLHVIEHIGLGRYGDRLAPSGSREACRELARVLASGGNLFLTAPVGRSRVCFNAQRIHTAETIREYLSDLDLVEFSGVDDDGRFVEQASMVAFGNRDCACGMFWFRKPQR